MGLEALVGALGALGTGYDQGMQEFRRRQLVKADRTYTEQQRMFAEQERQRQLARQLTADEQRNTLFAQQLEGYERAKADYQRGLQDDARQREMVDQLNAPFSDEDYQLALLLSSPQFSMSKLPATVTPMMIDRAKRLNAAGIRTPEPPPPPSNSQIIARNITGGGMPPAGGAGGIDPSMLDMTKNDPLTVALRQKLEATDAAIGQQLTPGGMATVPAGNMAPAPAGITPDMLAPQDTPQGIAPQDMTPKGPQDRQAFLLRALQDVPNPTKADLDFANMLYDAANQQMIQVTISGQQYTIPLADAPKYGVKADDPIQFAMPYIDERGRVSRIMVPANYITEAIAAVDNALYPVKIGNDMQFVKFKDLPEASRKQMEQEWTMTKFALEQGMDPAQFGDTKNKGLVSPRASAEMDYLRAGGEGRKADNKQKQILAPFEVAKAKADLANTYSTIRNREQKANTPKSNVKGATVELANRGANKEPMSVAVYRMLKAGYSDVDLVAAVKARMESAEKSERDTRFGGASWMEQKSIPDRTLNAQAYVLAARQYLDSGAWKGKKYEQVLADLDRLSGEKLNALLGK